MSDSEGRILDAEEMFAWMCDGHDDALEADHLVYRSHEALRAALDTANQRADDNYGLYVEATRERDEARAALVTATTERDDARAALRDVGTRWTSSLARVGALEAALPKVPWGENDECYSCGSGEGDPHFDGCAWVVARALLVGVPDDAS